MSAIEARPPEAITGIETASASRMVASQLMPVEHAVAVDVGVDDRRHAGVLEARAISVASIVGGRRPALDRHLAAAGVDADGDLPGMGVRRLAHEPRVAHRGSAQDERARRLSRASHRSRRRRGCRRRAAPVMSPKAARIASTAASLRDLAGEGAVEIDHVQPGKADLPEGARRSAGSSL